MRNDVRTAQAFGQSRGREAAVWACQGATATGSLTSALREAEEEIREGWARCQVRGVAGLYFTGLGWRAFVSLD